MSEQNKQKRKAMNYMRGWITSAGCSFIPPELADDDDFAKGLADGKTAKMNAKNEAQKKYSIVFAKIVLANSIADNRPG